jgi:hypothetical protein
VGEDEARKYQRYQYEAEVLGRIGTVLFEQPTTLTMSLPKELADLALAAWQRDTDGDPLGPETTEQRITRHRAGTLGLIGLSIEKTGLAEGDNVVCELDAWYVGGALEAADDYGLLADRIRAMGRREQRSPGSQATE